MATPTHGSLIEVLARWRGGKAFFDPLRGNNGDRLIELGAHSVIRKVGLELTPDASAADVIIVNGGAGLTDVWYRAFADLERLSTEHPATPLVVMPSTIQFSDPSTLQNALTQRTGPTHLFCREQNSFERVTGVALPECVEVGLDHDMAFALADDPWIEPLRRQKGRYDLIVERADGERVTGQAAQAFGPAGLRRYVPFAVKRPLKRMLLQRSSPKTPFFAATTRFLSDVGGAPAGRVVAYDVSRPDAVSFDGFCKTIAGASRVLSTRLHVGILAAILGKPTFVVAGLKKLGKIDGIYRHSMRDMPNVQLVAYENEQLTPLADG